MAVPGKRRGGRKRKHTSKKRSDPKDTGSKRAASRVRVGMRWHGKQTTAMRVISSVPELSSFYLRQINHNVPKDKAIQATKEYAREQGIRWKVQGRSK